VAKAYEVHVKGLGSALEIPAKLERSRVAFKLSVGEGLVEEIRHNIRSRSGKLAASWQARHVRGAILLQSKGVLYARASVGGAFLVPKNKRALAFADGTVRMRARLNPGAYIGRPNDRRTSYVTLAFHRYHEITRAAWLLHFGKLGV
jgi:hypothetical protein